MEVMWSVVCVMICLQSTAGMLDVLRCTLTQSPKSLSPISCKVFSSFLLSYATMSITVILRQEKETLFHLLLIWLILFACITLALHIASTDRVYTKTKPQLLAMLMQDLQHAPMLHIRSSRRLLRHALSKACAGVVIGGIIIGLAMLASFTTLHFSYVHWDVQQCDNAYLLFLAALYAILGMLVCLLLFFRVIPLFPKCEILRFTSVALSSVIIIGCYYLCKAAFRYSEDSAISTQRQNIVSGVKVGALVIFSIAQYLINRDFRQRVHSAMCQAHNMETDARMEKDDDHSVIVELSQSIQLQRNIKKSRPIVVRSCASVSRVHITEPQQNIVDGQCQVQSQVTESLKSTTSSMLDNVV